MRNSAIRAGTRFEAFRSRAGERVSLKTRLEQVRGSISSSLERRDGPDRRRQPRGGRRPSDQPGFSPLVMIVDADASRRARSEAILGRFKFAVVPADSVEKALAILNAERPAAIVGPAEDLARLRQDAGGDAALVEVATMLLGTDAIVEAIRAGLRARA